MDGLYTISLDKCRVDVLYLGIYFGGLYALLTKECMLGVLDHNHSLQAGKQATVKLSKCNLNNVTNSVSLK